MSAQYTFYQMISQWENGRFPVRAGEKTRDAEIRHLQACTQAVLSFDQAKQLYQTLPAGHRFRPEAFTVCLRCCEVLTDILRIEAVVQPRTPEHRLYVEHVNVVAKRHMASSTTFDEVLQLLVVVPPTLAIRRQVFNRCVHFVRTPADAMRLRAAAQPNSSEVLRAFDLIDKLGLAVVRRCTTFDAAFQATNNFLEKRSFAFEQGLRHCLDLQPTLDQINRVIGLTNQHSDVSHRAHEMQGELMAVVQAG